jgi:hypothetical protein
MESFQDLKMLLIISMTSTKRVNSSLLLHLLQVMQVSTEPSLVALEVSHPKESLITLVQMIMEEFWEQEE